MGVPSRKPCVNRGTTPARESRLIGTRYRDLSVVRKRTARARSDTYSYVTSVPGSRPLHEYTLGGARVGVRSGTSPEPFVDEGAMEGSGSGSGPGRTTLVANKGDRDRRRTGRGAFEYKIIDPTKN